MQKIKKYIIIITSILLCTFLGYSIYKFYEKVKIKEKEEHTAYANLDKDNYNIEDYQNFINTYPQSEHYKEIKQKLVKLKNMSAAWQQIKKSNNINKFVDFKNLYHDNFYGRLCDLKIDSLDWRKAQSQNTPESYKIYIDLHPNGSYVSEAKKAKIEVAYMDISENEKKHIHSICSKFFSSLGVNDRMGFCIYLAKDIEQFIDMFNVNRMDILFWAEENVASHTFINYRIKGNPETLKFKNDRNKVYFVTTFTLEEITTDEVGNERIKEYTAQINLNKAFQINLLKLTRL